MCTDTFYSKAALQRHDEMLLLLATFGGFVQSLDILARKLVVI